jgi:hypothetical protein
MALSRAGLTAALTLIAAVPSGAQSTGTWNGLPDRFRIDAGYFRLSPTTILRYNPSGGGTSEVELENDLGFDSTANTFWIDSTWRLGRRHQIKLAYTSLSRDALDYTIQRDFSWGGQTYNAGLNADSTNGTKLLGGYYRFAIYRNDRFEIGPALGIGYIWLDARIQATGTITGPAGEPVSRSLDESASTSSVTGAVGGYADAWLAERLVVRGDFLYIKVKPGDSEAAVTDWRLGADYYFFKGVGLGAQYKFYRYSYDRGLLSRKLGGEITYKGFQVFLSALF